VSSHVSRLTAFDIAADGTLSNRRVWADGVGPDGICLDAEGCIWASSGAMINDCARIREGGQVAEKFELDRPCFAAMLGGPDRRSLFMLTADTGEWGTYAWAAHVLGAPGYRIAGGSDEIQRNIIAERVLGLPAEPRVDRDLPWRDVPR